LLPVVKSVLKVENLKKKPKTNKKERKKKEAAAAAARIWKSF